MGVELAVEARDYLPDVKILLTSGYPGEALAITTQRNRSGR